MEASEAGPAPLPAWVPGRTIYHLHALRAAGDRGLPALTGWLDHVAGLGAGAVLLTPVHHSVSHGYDTVDALRLDPRLGTDDDLDAFVAACHERGLRLLFDGVFNHVGRRFARTDWLSGTSWEGHDELAVLDHANHEVADWARRVARHWIDRGGDGWRFDVAYAIPPSFLRSLTDDLRAEHPDAFLFGEVIHGDYLGLVARTGLHSVTQYELYKAIWSSLNDANLWELAWALERHRTFAAAFAPVTFVGNHDVTRIATALDDPALLDAALAVLFTVPGVPCVYYGDELGWTGRKEDRAGGDDAVRPPLPDEPPVGGGAVLEAHRRWIAFRAARPELTTAKLAVLDRCNRTIDYRVGSVRVRIDLDRGVHVEG